MKANSDVDEYLNQFDGDVKDRLLIIRDIVSVLVPDAEEMMSYGLVGYKLNKKPLLYFGGFRHHIGLYATPSGHEQFKDDFSKYKQGKGSVQLPLDQPLPIDLINRVVKYRVSQLT